MNDEKIILESIPENPDDLNHIDQGDLLKVENVRDQIKETDRVILYNQTKEREIKTKFSLSDRQLEAVLDGGIINNFKKKKSNN